MTMVRGSSELTQEELKAILHYDPETGIFTWTVTSGGAIKGSRAGSLRGKKEGARRYIGIKGKYYLDNRLAFLYMEGCIPEIVDHINRNPLDSRWINLRGATPSQNSHNAKRRSDNKSGVKGIHKHKVNSKWIAAFRFKGKYIYVGSFDDIEEAGEALIKKRKELHGDFACNG